MEKSFQRHALLVTLSLLFFSIPVSISLPFVMFHGLGGECTNDKVTYLTQLFKNLSGSPGYCVEIGNGKSDSIHMPLMKQASIACEKIKQMKELSQGYNIVAESQGNLVARGLIEFCDNAPPIFNYVSLGGPHAGVTGIPEDCTDKFCEVINYLLPHLYDDFFQYILAPSGYVKIPTEITKYLEHSKYLPKLNNERPNERNSTFKDRFTSLQNLVLIMFQDDQVLSPKETSWFGFYPDGASTTLLPPNETKLYTEDWIGLKTLDAAGKVQFISVPGGHIEITEEDVKKYVAPYLKTNEPTISSETILNHEAM